MIADAFQWFVMSQSTHDKIRDFEAIYPVNIVVVSQIYHKELQVVVSCLVTNTNNRETLVGFVYYPDLYEMIVSLHYLHQNPTTDKGVPFSSIDDMVGQCLDNIKNNWEGIQETLADVAPAGPPND
jgi:hypothetical protein